MPIDLDEIEKHMAARNHLGATIRYGEELRQHREMVYQTLADDVPDLVAEARRLRQTLRGLCSYAYATTNPAFLPSEYRDAQKLLATSRPTEEE